MGISDYYNKVNIFKTKDKVELSENSYKKHKKFAYQ